MPLNYSLRLGDFVKSDLRPVPMDHRWRLKPEVLASYWTQELLSKVYPDGGEGKREALGKLKCCLVGEVLAGCFVISS